MHHLDMQALHTAVPLPDATATNLDAIRSYVLYWARHPEPGSFFAKFTWLIRLLPDDAYLWLLHRRRYGGQILIHNGGIVGHIFYQQHGDEVHMFSVEVDEDYQERGYGNRLMRSFLLDMGNRTHVNWLRISAGGSEVVKHMWQKVLKGEYHLPYRVEPGYKPGLGWVRIIR